jgi:hypothetical protein
VTNGSFEEIDTGWTWGGGLGVHPGYGAAGDLSVTVYGHLGQDLTTVSGRVYVVSFAVNGKVYVPSVTWGGAALTPFTNYASAGVYWNYRYIYAQAQSNVTRLQFENQGTIDDVKVGWVEEPIQLLSQPESRSSYEGASASFSVVADGAPPLKYQWRFNGSPIPGGTNSSLTVTPLARQHEGRYSVEVSNSWSDVLSSEAELQVTAPPGTPVIVAHPVGDLCPAGYGTSLRVVAVGEPTLEYQWRREGENVSGGTNASLVFESVQTTDAGTYTVLVSNQRGSVLSLPATIAVTNSSGGGLVVLDTMTNNAPIYDVDGATRLAGPQFVAQVYAGAAPDILRPVGAVIVFPSGMFAGYLRGIMRTIPDVAPMQLAYVQVRAWEGAWGATYEAARAKGGKYGFSSIASVRASSFNNMVRLRSFSLRAGEPFFVTGVLSIGDQLPDGTQQYVLTGEPGARYLIESRQPPNSWLPLIILTNSTGTTLFSDPNQAQHPLQFYRSRILD